jgi:hypothetical protein
MPYLTEILDEIRRNAVEVVDLTQIKEFSFPQGRELAHTKHAYKSQVLGFVPLSDNQFASFGPNPEREIIIWKKDGHVFKSLSTVETTDLIEQNELKDYNFPARDESLVKDVIRWMDAPEAKIYSVIKLTPDYAASAGYARLITETEVRIWHVASQQPVLIHKRQYARHLACAGMHLICGDRRGEICIFNKPKLQQLSQENMARVLRALKTNTSVRTIRLPSSRLNEENNSRLQKIPERIRLEYPTLPSPYELFPQPETPSYTRRFHEQKLTN